MCVCVRCFFMSIGQSFRCTFLSLVNSKKKFQIETQGPHIFLVILVNLCQLLTAEQLLRSCCELNSCWISEKVKTVEKVKKSKKKLRNAKWALLFCYQRLYFWQKVENLRPKLKTWKTKIKLDKKCQIEIWGPTVTWPGKSI